MTVAQKIQALADQYETTPQTIRIFIANGRIPGAIAVKHEHRHAFIFSPELNKTLEETK